MIFFLFFIQVTFGSDEMVLTPLTIKKGQHIYDILVNETDDIQIIYHKKLEKELNVYKINSKVMIISPKTMEIFYTIVHQQEDIICSHCQYNCQIETNTCFNEMKQAVFTFDEFLDFIIPNRSLLVFIMFIVLVIISLIMILTMCCRFIDCFTDIFCDPKKKKNRQLEKELRKDGLDKLQAAMDCANELTN